MVFLTLIGPGPVEPLPPFLPTVAALAGLLFFLWLVYIIFVRKGSVEVFEDAESPIFEWPDVLLQEKAFVAQDKNNVIPLPAHQYSLGMKFLIWGLIVGVFVVSIFEPNFIINGLFGPY